MRTSARRHLDGGWDRAASVRGGTLGIGTGRALSNWARGQYPPRSRHLSAIERGARGTCRRYGRPARATGRERRAGSANSWAWGGLVTGVGAGRRVACPEDAIADTVSELTMVGGRVVYGVSAGRTSSPATASVVWPSPARCWSCPLSACWPA